MGTSAPTGIRLGAKAHNVCVHCNGHNSDPRSHTTILTPAENRMTTTRFASLDRRQHRCWLVPKLTASTDWTVATL